TFLGSLLGQATIFVGMVLIYVAGSFSCGSTRLMIFARFTRQLGQSHFGQASLHQSSLSSFSQCCRPRGGHCASAGLKRRLSPAMCSSSPVISVCILTARWIAKRSSGSTVPTARFWVGSGPQRGRCYISPAHRVSANHPCWRPV